MAGKAKLMAAVLLLILHHAAWADSGEYTVRTVLEDGTTFLHTYDESRRLLKEEIIITSGRHKTTYFDSSGQPKYGVVETGSGYFGLMYYDRAQAPLFKFWDYGSDGAVVQFYSTELEPIAAVKVLRSGGVRKVEWSGKPCGSIYCLLPLTAACLIVGAAFGMLIRRAKRTS